MGETFNYDITQISIPKQNKPQKTLSWKNSIEHNKLVTEKEKNRQSIHKESNESRKQLLLEQLWETNANYSGDEYLEKNNNSLLDSLKKSSESGLAQFSDYFSNNENLMCPISNIEEKNQAELRIYQDKLINKILGTDKGFNDKYIKGFDKNLGNHLIEIEDFENYIFDEDIKDINSLLLKNYLKYLISIKDNTKIKKLKDFLGSIVIKKIENKNSNFLKSAEEILTEMLSELSNKIQSIFGKITNFETFNKEFKGLDEIERDEMIKQLKEDDKLKTNFIKSIQESLPKNKEKRLQIATDFVENLINTPNIGDILNKIEAFEKKQGINLNKKEVSKNTLQNQQHNTQIEILEAKQKGDIIAEKKAIEKLKQINYNTNIIRAVSNEQIESITDRLHNGESFDNIIQEIAQDNEELRDILDEEKENNEKSNSEVENEENHNEEEDHSNYNFDKNDYLPNTEQEGGFNIKIGGVEIKGLTKKEKENTMGNPEALKNLVDFYQFFKDLNLEGVWKYRGKLTTTIGSRYININDNNSISKAELLKFGNALINIINNIPKEEQDKNILKRSNSINAIKNELRKYSGASSSLNNEQTYNINGEDKFTSQLRGLGIIGGAYFHTAQLRKLTK